MLTSVDLKLIMPAAQSNKIDLFLPWFNKYLVIYELNTPSRIAAFLSNIAHESMSLHYVKEIASGKAYEGRKDLGNTIPGDGIKFKGRGLIQITGRSNYMNCSRNLFGNEKQLVNFPELLEQPQFAVQSALWFWKEKSLNLLSDRIDVFKPLIGDNLKAFKAVVKRINGGYNGLDDRILYWNRAVSLFISSADVLQPERPVQTQGHPNSNDYRTPNH